ncbi:helix-hairpin-helix domain-containing protein [Clostridium botulinum]|uniref:helix-hairpin-helix domain-containing protein n=1 Tax=Clostridium botulinum TaxID=1491 RepID=UPI00077367C3|nr:helix-hairpin-helix domain-containing protein [Clostridium botulinum]AUN04411.1 DNA-binding protein [Clostridium botulinum]MBN3411597.1 DNA-binding protein [Clostridium botulinum]
MKDKKKIIGSIIIVFILAVFTVIGYVLSKPEKANIKEEEIFVENVKSTKKENAKLEKEITVYVNGEVKNPGVYKLKDNSRVEELIKISGGYTSNADTCKLNLAKKLKDEDYIYIEKKGGNNGGADNSEVSTNSGIGADGKIDLNSASKEELKSIPGIGDVTAQKILDYREKQGTFKNFEDLKAIGRIGDKTIEKIKEEAEIR